MLGITDLSTFVVGTIVIVLLPGPNSLYVLSAAMRLGVAAGIKGAAGIFVGDSVLMALTVLGAASLLHRYPLVFTALRWVGAIYLAYLGVQLIYAAYVRWRGQSTERVGSDQLAGGVLVSGERPFHRALAISLLNPKAILFFLSFFIQFVDPAYAYTALSFTLLALIVQITSVTYLALLIGFATPIARQTAHQPVLASLGMATAGLLFIGFGLRLVATSVPGHG